jgi:hypothetical protein
MSTFANLPTTIALPQELEFGSLKPVIPYETTNNSVKVYAINQPSVSATLSTGASSATAGVTPDQSFPQTDIVFDLPASMANTVIDTRFSSINYKMTITVGTAGAGTVVIDNANLRSSGYSWFDNLRVTGQTNILENIQEFGLTMDTVLQATMGQADRECNALNYGFKSNFTGINNIGMPLPVLTKGTASFGTNGLLTTGATTSTNFTLPLPSAIVGVLNDKFFPIGLTKKLLVALTTASIAPITIYTGTTVGTAVNYTVTLSDFWLNLEYINIGSSAMSQIVSSLHDGKMFLNGQTYRTTTSPIGASQSGALTIPCAISGTSVKSLIVRFHETKASPDSTTSLWGKYSSSNPNLNAVSFNVSGLNTLIYDPLKYPAQAFRNLLLGFGSYNSTQFSSSISPVYYTRLTSGGTSSGLTSTTQDQLWQTGCNIGYQNAFFISENLEKIPRRSIMGGGTDLTYSKLNLNLNIAAANSNPVNVYVHALLDTIIVVDINSGDVTTLI